MDAEDTPSMVLKREIEMKNVCKLVDDVLIFSILYYNSH